MKPFLLFNFPLTGLLYKMNHRMSANFANKGILNANFHNPLTDQADTSLDLASLCVSPLRHFYSAEGFAKEKKESCLIKIHHDNLTASLQNCWRLLPSLRKHVFIYLSFVYIKFILFDWEMQTWQRNEFDVTRRSCFR